MSGTRISVALVKNEKQWSCYQKSLEELDQGDKTDRQTDKTRRGSKLIPTILSILGQYRFRRVADPPGDKRAGSGARAGQRLTAGSRWLVTPARISSLTIYLPRPSTYLCIGVSSAVVFGDKIFHSQNELTSGQLSPPSLPPPGETRPNKKKKR